MNKSIIFDSSSIISISMNDLIWTLESLKSKFKGDFYISKSVKEELVDRPLKSKKFKFEAMTIMNLIDNGILKVYDGDQKRKDDLLELANSIFVSKNERINILHSGEMGCIVSALELGSRAMVIDERTTRLLIEDPDQLHSLLEYKLHTKIKINKDKLNMFREMTKGIKIIRSTELMMMAYEMKLFEKFSKIKLKEVNKELLDGILWGLKLRGCSISEKEINDIIKLEKK